MGIELEFRGSGIDEIGKVVSVTGDLAPAVKAGDVIVRIDPKYFRPAEVETLLGNPAKAKSLLGWEPRITAREMCREMVREDLRSAKREVFMNLYHTHTPTPPWNE